MDAVQFRVNGLVVEYRTLRICSGLIQCGGYTEWQPVPTVQVATITNGPSSYDCGARVSRPPETRQSLRASGLMG
jgi:hypothetical protein